MREEHKVIVPRKCKQGIMVSSSKKHPPVKKLGKNKREAVKRRHPDRGHVTPVKKPAKNELLVKKQAPKLASSPQKTAPPIVRPLPRPIASGLREIPDHLPGQKE